MYKGIFNDIENFDNVFGSAESTPHVISADHKMVD
jgi:hypothetical protein